MSGGFSGQVAVYGIPSGRLLKVIPVFSQNGENGYGYDENTKPMLNTSFGFVPWDDSHHTQLSETDAMYDGRWLFINANNTPRIARIDLKNFQTAEIIELPNTAGNHASPSLHAIRNTSLQALVSVFLLTIRMVTCQSKTIKKISTVRSLI